MTPTLDTSGAVEIPDSGGQVRRGRLWSDLTPFAQGYVEALFASFQDADTAFVLPQGDGHAATFFAKFSDLSPEALALILRDCEVAGWGYEDRADLGREVWAARQRGEYIDRPKPFPPLTPYLSDDDKVCLREAGQ